MLKGHVSTINSLPLKSTLEANIIQQMLQAIVLVRVVDLLETLPQLKVAITKEESDHNSGIVKMEWKKKIKNKNPFTVKLDTCQILSLTLAPN